VAPTSRPQRAGFARKTRHGVPDIDQLSIQTQDANAAGILPGEARLPSPRNLPCPTASLTHPAQGERVFGADAEAIAARKPYNVFPDAFRLLGRNATHPSVIDFTQRSYIAAGVEPNERAGVNFVVPPDAGKDSVQYTAEEAVAMLLAHAREFTEAFGSVSIKDAVITVPTYFTQAREAR
jgi:molecular chaperone DnaK (HSP70)